MMTVITMLVFMILLLKIIWFNVVFVFSNRALGVIMWERKQIHHRNILKYNNKEHLYKYTIVNSVILALHKLQ